MRRGTPSRADPPPAAVFERALERLDAGAPVCGADVELAPQAPRPGEAEMVAGLFEDRNRLAVTSGIVSVASSEPANVL